MRKIKFIIVIIAFLFFNFVLSKHQINLNAAEGDSYLEPKIIQTNQTVKGFLTNSQDANVYKFIAPETGYIQISFRNEYIGHTYKYWDLELFDDLYNHINTRVWSVRGDTDYQSPIIGVMPGQYYYLTITDSSYFSDADYYFEIKFTLEAYHEIEHNDSGASNASNMSKLNQEYFGSLHDSNDTDYYCFELTKKGYINIEFLHDYKNKSNHNYWSINLYQYENSKLNSINSKEYVVNDTDDFNSPTIGLNPGKYYIKINKSTYFTSSTYRLKVNYVETEFCESEKNNTKITATPILVNQDYVAAINNSDDSDYYVFTLPKPGYISVKFTHTLTTSTYKYWQFELLGADGVSYIDANEKTWVVAGNVGEVLTLDIGVDAGTYYFWVGDYPSHLDTSDYHFIINYEETEFWEKEDNSTSEVATNISCNAEYFGTLNTYYDYDWYTFELLKDGYFSFDFIHEDNGVSKNLWKLSFYQSNAKTLLGSDSEYWIDGINNLRTPIYCLPAGKYYLLVEGGGNASYTTTMKYSMKINFVENEFCEKEDNDVSDKANYLDLSQKYMASLHEDDIDWYAFQIPSDGYITISFTHDVLDSNVYWNFDIYNQTANDKVYNNDTYYFVRGDDNEDTRKLGLAAGYYLIKVYRKSNVEISTIPYYLQVNFTASEYYEKEYNDTPDTSTSIELENDYFGNMFSDDVDWYKFEVNKKGSIIINFSHELETSSTIYWKVYLYNDTNTSTAYQSFNVTAGANLVSKLINVSQGTYYVKVIPGNTRSGMIYTLKINHIIHVESVAINETEQYYEKKDSFMLTVTVLPVDANDKSIRWESSDEAIATVNDGIVTPLAIGTVTIKAISNDNNVIGKKNITIYCGSLHSLTGEVVDSKYLASPATCETKATYYKICLNCLEVSNETFEVGEKLNHIWDNKYTFNDEIHYFACLRTDCKGQKEATNHTGLEADCINKAICSVCKNTYGTPLGHDLVYYEALAPTCTTSGYEAYESCTRCDYTTYVESVAYGHEYDLLVIENVIEPTCTTEGSYEEVYYCLYCEVELERYYNYEAALGHEEIKHASLAPTCVQSGHPEYVTCRRCDYTTFVSLPAIDHQAGHSVIENQIPATCTEDGSYDEVSYCLSCGSEISRTTIEIEQLHHNYEYSKTVEPDYLAKQDGYDLYLCTNDNTHQDTRNIIEWEALKVVITFETNSDDIISSINSYVGDKINTLTNPIKEGYKFVAWYLEADLINKVDTPLFPTENLKLYAKYELLEYSITYHLNGGLLPYDAPETYTILAKPQLLNPTKQNHTFVCWLLNGKSITQLPETIVGNIELEAVWEENSKKGCAGGCGGSVATSLLGLGTLILGVYVLSQKKKKHIIK